MESAFVSQPRTPAWPVASSALSQQPGPTPEARDDQPPSSRPSVPPRSAHRSPQRLRRALRAGDHRLFARIQRPVTCSCSSIDAATASRSSTGIATVWRSGTNDSKPGSFQLPVVARDAVSIEMTPTQLALILSGIDLQLCSATQAVSASDAGSRKIDRFPLVTSDDRAIIPSDDYSRVMAD